MSYKYFPASLTTRAEKGTSPKKDYKELFQETLNEQFYNASNWQTVEEETSTGEGTYRDVDVRIAHLINAETGLKLGDDWKTLLFMDLDHPIEMGRFYRFDDNYWLTINKEGLGVLTNGCTIRRCNNTLRWMDSKTGAIYKEPCCIEYMVKEPRNYMTQGSPFITPGGFLHIETQLNENTAQINENQRFLFGNPNHWTAYRVIGTGINDFRNEKTMEHSTAKVLTLDLVADFLSEELDDIVNGICDIYRNTYTVTLNHSSVTGKKGEQIQLIPTVTHNGITTERPMVWSSDNEPVASVDVNGVVTFNEIGTAKISVQILNNPAISTCQVSVTDVASDTFDIRISPDKNYILESTTQVFTVFLYKNGEKQNVPVTVSCDGNGVPLEHYKFEQPTENTFKISNRKRHDTLPVIITCTAEGVTESFEIKLKAAW